MITLFIDTSSVDVSIVILKDNKVLNFINTSIPNMHSIYVVPFIDKVLKESDLKPNDIDRIMVCTGPGSFTGVRIGVTVAKVYAYALKKEVIAVDTLKALALSSEKDYIISLINARNDNYYCGIYDKDYNTIEEHFMTKKEILKKLELYTNYHLVGYQEEDFDLLKIEGIKLDYSKIEKYYDKKEPTNIHSLNPTYLKLPSVMEQK